MYTDPAPEKTGTIVVNLLFLPSEAGLSFIGCVKCCCKGILFVSFLEMYPKLFQWLIQQVTPDGGIQGEKNVHCSRFTQGVEGSG
jgi:hypothetical protein